MNSALQSKQLRQQYDLILSELRKALSDCTEENESGDLLVIQVSERYSLSVLRQRDALEKVISNIEENYSVVMWKKMKQQPIRKKKLGTTKYPKQVILTTDVVLKMSKEFLKNELEIFSEKEKIRNTSWSNGSRFLASNGHSLLSVTGDFGGSETEHCHRNKQGRIVNCDGISHEEILIPLCESVVTHSFGVQSVRKLYQVIKQSIAICDKDSNFSLYENEDGSLGIFGSERGVSGSELGISGIVVDKANGFLYSYNLEDNATFIVNVNVSYLLILVKWFCSFGIDPVIDVCLLSPSMRAVRLQGSTEGFLGHSLCLILCERKLSDE